MKSSQKIQVYGLPRSGTNFIEWTLVNNFTNVAYENRYREPFPGLKERLKTAWKHSEPEVEEGVKSIIVLRDFDAWVKSMKKDRRSVKTSFEEVYVSFLSAAHMLFDNNPEDVFIVTHESAVENYELLLTKLSSAFGLNLKPDWRQPKHKMCKGGSNAKETGVIYTYEKPNSEE